MKNDFLFDPFSESFVDDIKAHAVGIKPVRDKLDFLYKHAVTDEAWKLFSSAVLHAYLKNHLYTSDEVKLLLDKIETLEKEIEHANKSEA